MKVALDDGQKHVATERHIDLATDLEADVKIRVGAAHKTKWNPSGYRTGNDVCVKLKHAITLFEVLHPGCKGLFLFDNSTGQNKMTEDALITSRLNIGPGGQVRLLD